MSCTPSSRASGDTSCRAGEHFGGYQAARLEHFTLTLGYLAFFLVHIVQVIRAGWNNLRSMITGYELEEER